MRKERENHRVQAVITPAFPAQWFTAYSALSPVNLADCHRRRDAKHHRQLGASLWGARTTRLHRPRHCRTSDSTGPSTTFRTTFVTTRNAPLIGSGTEDTIRRIRNSEKTNIFSPAC
jgi:hypothetical protein